MRSLKRITGAFERGGEGKGNATKRHAKWPHSSPPWTKREMPGRASVSSLPSFLFSFFFFLLFFFLFLVDERHETERKTRLIRLREEIINEARMWATVKNTRQCRNGISVKNKPTGIDFSNRRR